MQMGAPSCHFCWIQSRTKRRIPRPYIQRSRNWGCLCAKMESQSGPSTLEQQRLSEIACENIRPNLNRMNSCVWSLVTWNNWTQKGGEGFEPFRNLEKPPSLSLTIHRWAVLHILLFNYQTEMGEVENPLWSFIQSVNIYWLPTEDLTLDK